ncbi:hypothetical protein F8S13_11365 [Chloroflexia bacterium SDU3-3]|nr:hypothetical protein F8S13_11365 [Chloroflexia bacterium SDU3-3]
MPISEEHVPLVDGAQVVYLVTDGFEVYDHPSAELLDHVLSHIHALNVATSMLIPPAKLYERYNLPNAEPSLAPLLALLQRDLGILSQAMVEMAAARADPDCPRRLERIIAEVRARVPYLGDLAPDSGQLAAQLGAVLAAQGRKLAAPRSRTLERHRVPRYRRRA